MSDGLECTACGHLYGHNAQEDDWHDAERLHGRGCAETQPRIARERAESDEQYRAKVALLQRDRDQNAAANFVSLPGFFRIEKGSRAISPGNAETWWQVGAATEGEPHVVRWGAGPRLAAAVQTWRDRWLPDDEEEHSDE